MGRKDILYLLEFVGTRSTHIHYLFTISKETILELERTSSRGSPNNIYLFVNIHG